MPKVFISQRSLDFQWEIIIHPQQAVGSVIDIEFVAEVPSDDTKDEWSKLSKVPGSAAGEVGVVYC